MKFIKKIEIRKFRSINNVLKIVSDDLNIFVGSNDQGKSNVLRALNLFFNNETDHSTKFRFIDDYCFSASTGTGSRREIRIDLIISPPKGRFKTTGDIKWVKKWKQDGSVIEERRKCSDDSELLSTDNLSKWLDKLRYRYVPAIKSEMYFTMLMGELHDVLNLKFEENIAEKGSEFIGGIQALTNGLTFNLEASIGIKNTLQAPSNFRQLFSSLNFGSIEGDSIYRLNQRGDGIKIRHIPIILHYMAMEERNLSIPGYVKPDTIWGFEEPENNLELSNCFKMANDFLGYTSDLQIFVTTHSPAFYSLNGTPKTSVFHVKKVKETTQVQPVEKLDALHKEMGLLPLITPYIEQVIQTEKDMEALKLQLALIEEDTIKIVVLTEDSDTRMLSSYLKHNGMNNVSTEIISYNCSSEIYTSAFTLAKYLREKKPEVKILIHRDRDYLSDDEVAKVQKRIQDSGYSYLIPVGVDIESIFLNSKHVFELYPELKLSEIESMIEESISVAENYSLERLYDHTFKTARPKEGAYGKAIRELQSKYESDKMRYCYGKKVLGVLKSKIQQKIKSNPDLFSHSTEITNDYLIKFFTN